MSTNDDDVADLDAARAASRQEEVDALRAELARLEAERAETAKEIERLRGHLDLDSFATLNDCADEGARLCKEAEAHEAEIAKLTAELTTAVDSANAVIDALEARVRAFQRVTGDPDAEAVTPEMVAGVIARLTAERDRARDEAFAAVHLIHGHKIATARAEGAREEREAIAPLLIQLAERIRARGTGDPEDPSPITNEERERWRRHGSRYAMGYTAGEKAERDAIAPLLIQLADAIHARGQAT